MQYASWCWMSASLDSLIINLYEAVMIVSLHLSAHEGSGLLPEFFFFSSVSLLISFLGT